jgi:2-dehydro-3-deoxyphosphogluconate aldolase/(4S)-4-hydroxy-2-oxoglutarate aldolase
MTMTASLADPLEVIRNDGVVPLYSSADVEVLLAVAEALVTGGIGTFEVVLRDPGTLDAFGILAQRVSQAGLPIILGAGTVLDARAADNVLNAGARIVLSPSVVPEVAEVCAAADVPYIPGCATPTEIHAALRLGCQVVKLFPAGTLGPEFIPQVRPVFPDVEYIPSGGMSPEIDVLRDWFGAGAMAVAVGSQLIYGRSPNTDVLKERASGLLKSIAEVRSELAQ